MDLERVIRKIRNHPDADKMGMIASHLGIVRSTTREGEIVQYIQVSYDLEVLNSIIKNIKKLPGIIEVIAEVNEGKLQVEDEILFVAIGGDIRENVFPALIKAVDLIKKDACKKREILA